jgi:hypothetical protein
MVSKYKFFILCVVIGYTLNGCIIEREFYNEEPTFSGYVAAEYTSNVIGDYSSILANVYIFNEYYSQPTTEKRDSVDRLYFMNTKIIRESDSYTWTLHKLISNNYGDITINTNGKALYDDGAVWIIMLHDYYYYESATSFGIEKIEDGHWAIKKHDNRNYDFDFSSEWDIKINKSVKRATIEGKGSLLSIATPKLKLDYTITEPLEASFADRDLFINAGAIRIFATDVDKNITEETLADIISRDNVRISHKNKFKNWYIPLSWGIF